MAPWKYFHFIVRKTNLCYLSVAVVVLFVIVHFRFLFNLGTRKNYSSTNGEDEIQRSVDNKNLNPSAVTSREIISKLSNDIKLEQSSNKFDKTCDIVIILKNVKSNPALQTKCTKMIDSLFKFSSVPLNVHVIGDSDGKKIATNIINSSSNRYKKDTKMIFHEVEKISHDVKDHVANMQTYFSHSQHAYYADALFFLSIVLHRIMSLDRVIMLDVDLKFNADIKILHDMFNEFSDSNIIGIARENQPVYRHTFSLYRSKNPWTRVGEPPPDGLTGFNSGVLLLHLQKMRQSKLYNDLITLPDYLNKLTSKYNFKGHLGDQDFYTIISLDYEDLFYVLPCSWNRQLCVWWRDHGYSNVFDRYYKCSKDIAVYHGNCNTQIPYLSWENV